MPNPISDPSSLAELLAYQADSVVSKVLCRNEGGVVTLFAFAKDQRLTEHSTPHDAIVLVLDGDVHITISDQSHTLGTGQILHLPPSVPHAVHGDGPFKLLLTILNKSKED